MEAQIRGQEYYLLTANVRADSAEAAAQGVLKHPDMAGLQGPTVAPVYSKSGDDASWYAVTIAVRTEMLLRAVDHLRAIGCSALTVSPVKYVFETESRSYARLLQSL
jgi:ATP phosphoribosyltransferase